MKLMSLALAIWLVMGLATDASALDVSDQAHDSSSLESMQTRGRTIATSVTQLTGVAIAPLLGMCAIGAFSYFTTPPPRRASLPWHRQPWFWGALLLLLVLEWAAHRIPAARTFAKALKVKEDQVTGIVGLTIFAAQAAGAISHPADRALSALSSFIIPSAEAATLGPHMMLVTSGAGFLVAFVLAFVIGGAVWMTAHAVPVVSLLLPFESLEWCLKAFRMALLLMLVCMAAIAPYAGLVVSAVYILIALLLAGWSFRLVIFGSVFASDILLLRWLQAEPPAGPIRAFTSEGMAGLPIRSYGVLQSGEAGLVFVHRRRLFASPRQYPIEGSFIVGIGLVSPVVLQTRGERDVNFFRLPPKYRCVSSPVAARLGGLPVKDVSILRRPKEALVWLRERANRIVLRSTM